MIDQNAFFCLKIESDKTSILLYPAKGAGKNLDFNEIDEYLTIRQIEYDKKLLYDTLNLFIQTEEIVLGKGSDYQVDEDVKIMVSNDNLKVIGRFYPPSSGGKLMSKEDIVTAMVNKGIKFGASEALINQFLENRQYCKDYILAEAMVPVEGKSAEIKYFFNTDISRKPKMNEDGSVDFHQLDNIAHVSKDELLAELIPADKGKPGIDVYGNILKPFNVSNKVLRYGRSIYINEEKTKIYSMVDGHVGIVDGMVFISDIYEVPADVDASTGDITYEGNVTVKGNVRTGYKIVAKGDIIVNGVVEGAELEAGGQIILKLGVQGMGKAVLKAGSNIVSRFIENAEVIAGGFITTEAIMHSKVTAQGDITINGKKSFVVGGEIRSASLIHAKSAGSTMGTATVIEVGVNPQIIEEYRRMEKEIPTMQAEIDRSKQLIAVYQKKINNGEKLPPDKLVYIKTTLTANKKMEDKIAYYQMKMASMQQEMDNNANGCIKIMDTIYPGCKLIISGVTQFIRTEAKHCRFVRDKADIRLGAY